MSFKIFDKVSKFLKSISFVRKVIGAIILIPESF